MTILTTNNFLFSMINNNKNITIIFLILFFITRFFHLNFFILILILFLFEKIKPELFLIIN